MTYFLLFAASAFGSGFNAYCYALDPSTKIAPFNLGLAVMCFLAAVLFAIPAGKRLTQEHS